MFRKFFTLIATAGVLIGGIAFISILGAMRPKVERQEPEVTPAAVLYEEATPVSVTLDVFAQGEVRPRTDISLTAQIAGIVAETSPSFVDGGAFEEGDLLIKIEDDDYRFAVTSARSRVAQAKELLAREEAESALAQRDFEELGGDIEASDLTLRKPQLAQARANYNAAVADLRAAELNLSRTTLTAPFKGRVRERLVGPGQYVAPGSQLGRLFSTDVAEIRLPLTDGDIAKLGLPVGFVASGDNPGPVAELSAMLGGRLHEWRGHVERTDGAIDPTTRQISAIAVVNDPYGEGADNGTPLAVGLFVDARVKGQPFDGAYVMTRKALYGRDRVYVVGANNILEERTVTIVATDRDSMTIVDGITAGERIVVSPLRGAGDGDEVLPEKAEPQIVSGSSIMSSIRPMSEDGEQLANVNAASINATPVADTRVTAEPAEEDDHSSIEAVAVAETPAQIQSAPASIEPVVQARDTSKPRSIDINRTYLPGERAPNDEVADELNRRQLERSPQAEPVDVKSAQDAGETL